MWTARGEGMRAAPFNREAPLEALAAVGAMTLGRIFKIAERSRVERYAPSPPEKAADVALRAICTGVHSNGGRFWRVEYDSQRKTGLRQNSARWPCIAPPRRWARNRRDLFPQSGSLRGTICDETRGGSAAPIFARFVGGVTLVIVCYGLLQAP